MRSKILQRINNILFEIMKNKNHFIDWLLIKSKWILYFICWEKGKEKENIEELKTEKLTWNGRGFRTMRWWNKNKGFSTNWQGEGWIYALLCQKTGDWYVGSTKRSMKDRFKEHIYEANRVWDKDKMERTPQNNVENWQHKLDYVTNMPKPR